MQIYMFKMTFRATVNVPAAMEGSHFLLVHKITVHACKIHKYVYYNLFLGINGHKNGG